jgi:2,3-dihydroxybenzoate-AMP ligase
VALAILGPEVRTLDEVLARRAADAPGSLAFAAQGERLTYGELRQEAAALAGGLAREGVRRGDRVVLLVPAGLDFVRAFFALQRLGAVPFALSPGLPPPTAARGRCRR